MSRRLLAAVTTVAVSLSMTAAAAAGATAAPPDTPDLPAADVGGLTAGAEAADKISPALSAAEGTVTVFVELDAATGVEVAEAGGDGAAVEAAAEQVEDLAAEVVPDGSGAPETLAVTTDLVAGAVVRGEAADLRTLAAKDGVASIRVMTPKVPMNKGTDSFTQALATWQATGYTGAGVTIGVIDTGLDYTHAGFGGPGTAEAYAEAFGADGTGAVPAGSYDAAKFLGGWDFAGHLYDASSTDPAEYTPVPDANPIDAPSGHGTHVSGSAAGYGVLADGSTFTGDYQSLTDISDWRVGPGSAPQAGIYALKVFGDGDGSTNLTMQALEWAADPNDDGDYSDHLDIVNMSLGSDYGPADDPENLFIDELTELGVLSVTASGNASDVVDVGGTPGNATSSLTVANSVGNAFDLDAVEVTGAADATAVGLYGGQNTIAYAGADVTAPVVYLGPTVDGCTSLAPYAEQIAGKIAYLWWDSDDTTRACGSGVRWNNAAAAGAAGAIVGWDQPVFTYGLTGSVSIPGAMLNSTATAALLPEIEAGTLTVHIGPSLAGAAFVSQPDAGDLVNPSSSRGVHGSLGIVKPDVAAPGTSISSVNAGGGTTATSKSGTSMATPHVAGIAALVREAHPRWSAQQVKAAVMNTATHDLFAEPGQTGAVYGPERVGSGRVDALAATTDSVIAYASDDPALVSVTFGIVPVGGETVVRQEKVTVRNLGRHTERFTTSFAQATGAGGATITVSPASITVPRGSSRTVTVTLTADPTSLAKELDPTSEAVQAGVPRDFVTTISGRLVLTGRDGELRVPVQAAPRLVSEMSAEPLDFAAGDSAPLTLTGRDALTGGWISIVAPMVLGASSPALPAEASAGLPPSVVRSGDLRYAGWASTAPQLAAAGADPADGQLGIGVAVEGEWTSLGSTVYPLIDIDVDGDGVAEFETVIWKYLPDVDVTTVETYAMDPSGAWTGLVDLNVVNGLTADVETTVFDNSVFVAPISLGALGLEPGDTPTVSVYTYSPYTEDVVDVLDPFTADPYTPPFWFDDGYPDSLWYVDTPGSAVTVHRSGATDAQVLLLHALNSVDSRAEVVEIDAPAPVTMRVSMPTVVTHRTAATVKVFLHSSEPPSGTVEVREGDRVLGTATVRTHGDSGVATVRLPKLGVGSHELTIAYSGNPDVEGATATKTLKVVRGR